MANEPTALLAYEQRWASQALDRAIERGDSEILVRGPRGVGKTIDFCYRFHRFALQYPGMTQIWCRSTRTRLTDSVLKTFENEVLGPRHPLYNSKSREQRSHYRYPNGSEIILMGLDDPERAKSVSADIVWINEPTDLTEAQWEEIGGATRKQMRNACPIRLKIGDFNPTFPEHWTTTRCPEFPQHLYPKVMDDGTRMGEWLTPEMYRETTRFNLAKNTTHKAKLIVYSAPDNPGYWSLEPWGWKPSGLDYAVNFLGKMSGTRKARYLAGKPMADEGGVFPEYDPTIHDCEDFEPPRGWPIIQGCDPGFGTTAWEWIALSPDGGIFFFDEIYEGGRAFSLHCEEANRRNKANSRNILRTFGDPNEVFSSTSQGASCASQAAKLGIRFVPWPADKGSAFVAGVESFRNFLIASPVVAPHYIRICKRCRGLRGNLSSWQFAKNRLGEIPEGAERYEKGNDHAIDVGRGCLQSKFLQKLFERGHFDEGDESSCE